MQAYIHTYIHTYVLTYILLTYLLTYLHPIHEIPVVGWLTVDIDIDVDIHPPAATPCRDIYIFISECIICSVLLLLLILILDLVLVN